MIANINMWIKFIGYSDFRLSPISAKA